MDIRQLEYFQMVGKLGNITRAAERLRVSQSTITIAIQRLEDQMDVQLFDRSQKQLALTTEGQVFWQKVTDILRQLQDAVAEAQNYRDLQKGTLKIGVPPLIASPTCNPGAVGGTPTTTMPRPNNTVWKLNNVASWPQCWLLVEPKTPPNLPTRAPRAHRPPV